MTTLPHPECKLTLNYLDRQGVKIGTFCPKCQRLGTQCYVEDHPSEQHTQGKYHLANIFFFCLYFVFIRVEFYFLLEINFLPSTFEFIIRLPMIFVLLWVELNFIFVLFITFALIFSLGILFLQQYEKGLFRPNLFLLVEYCALMFI